MEVCGQLYTLSAYIQEESPNYPLNRRLGRPWGLFETLEERKICCPYRKLNHDLLVLQTIAGVLSLLLI